MFKLKRLEHIKKNYKLYWGSRVADPSDRPL